MQRLALPAVLQFAAEEGEQTAPFSQKPVMQEEQESPGQTAQLAVVHAVQVGAVR